MLDGGRNDFKLPDGEVSSEQVLRIARQLDELASLQRQLTDFFESELKASLERRNKRCLETPPSALKGLNWDMDVRER